jgi:cytochrome b6-f complex iron-sulfur subunit
MIDLSDAGNAALKNVGGAVIKSGIIVIRRSSSAYVALSTTCTHASCTVNYSANSGRLVCPCHGSVFSNTGSVVQGPASRALPAYKVTVVGNNLTVTT